MRGLIYAISIVSLTSTTPALAEFGALAFDENTGVSALARNFATAEEAEQAALQKCPGCKILARTGAHQCVALAKVLRSTARAVRIGDNLDTVKHQAMEECAKNDTISIGCTLRDAACNETGRSKVGVAAREFPNKEQAARLQGQPQPESLTKTPTPIPSSGSPANSPRQSSTSITQTAAASPGPTQAELCRTLLDSRGVIRPQQVAAIREQNPLRKEAMEKKLQHAANEEATIFAALFGPNKKFEFTSYVGRITELAVAGSVEGGININVSLDCDEKNKDTFNVFVLFPRIYDKSELRNRFDMRRTIPLEETETEFDRFKPILTELNKGDAVAMSGIIFQNANQPIFSSPLMANFMSSTQIENFTYPTVNLRARLSELRKK
jgi:hypothetical protein